MNVPIKKRLLTMILTVVAVPWLIQKYGMPEETAQQFINVIMVYILGQSASDAVAIYKGNKKD